MRVDRLVCALAGATLLIGGSYADTANNSFASVSGNGVVADAESGFCIKNVEGSVEITVNERAGWKCEKGAPFSYVHKEGDIDYLKFFGRNDEETATIAISNIWACVHNTTNNDEHISAPGAEILEREHVLMMYAWPEEGGCELDVAKSICLPGLMGHHTNMVFALPCPNPKCDYGKKGNPIGGSDVKVDPSPVMAELNPLGGGIVQDDGRVLYPCGEYLVGYAAHCTNRCKDCEFEVGFERFKIDICKATSTAKEYIGLDRRDAGYEKDHTMSGVMTLDHVVGKASYQWAVKPHCKIEGKDNGAGVLVKVKRIAGELPGEWDFEYSGSYRQERLICDVKLKDGCSTAHEASTRTTNEFTIVKVDVRIDDVPESLEENEGAFTYYVPDGDAPIWAEEWTNSLKDVSITCEPHDGEMTKQTVKLTFDDEFLWVEKDDGTVEKAKHSYTVEELNKTKFKLHGHKKSAKYKDKEVVATHKESGAIDKAKFTVFGRPLLVPDYDRKKGIDDVDYDKSRGGVIPFRFWINDDDDTIVTGWKKFLILPAFFEKGNFCENNTNIPGTGNNSKNNEVDGRCDLVDFAPVLIDTSDVFPDSIPDNIRNTFTWKLDSDCLNLVWTDLAAANAASFHTQEVPHCGTGLSQQSYEADSVEIGYGREFDKAFATKIREVGKLVVLVEGRSVGRLFRISGNAPGTKAWTWGAVNISISKVEDMYRWMDLRYVCKDEPQGDDSGRDRPADFKGREDVNGPVNNPDSDCNGDPRDGRHILFVHGFNVNRDQARGWGAEFFKRLWQTGCTSKYTAVDWAGDVGQISIPFKGEDSINYYAGVYNAFKSSEEFASKCKEIQKKDSLVLVAHSLGNMLASSTITDRKVVPSRYYMVNAAVAMQAYNENVRTGNDFMKPAAWRGLDEHPSQSPYWHRLSILGEDDFRRTLTWLGRFKKVKNAVNCHATSDEIVGNINRDAWTSEDWGSAWTMQEKVKGSVVLPLANVLNNTSMTREGGWGFNIDYLGTVVGRNVDTAAVKKLSEEQLLVQPVFTPFVTEGEHLHSRFRAFRANGSEEQYKLRAKLLADAIPATSFSAGGNETPGLTNVDLMTSFESDKWPRSNSEWRHSDIKNVAFYFETKFYEFIRDNKSNK